MKRVVNNIDVNYFFEVDKESINTYYKFKNKNNLCFSNEEEELFLNKMKNLLVENIDFQNFDLILIPETKNKTFLKLVNGLGKELIIAKKRTVQEVLELLSLEKLQKLERKKLETVLSSMEEVQLAKIAGNQRIRIGKLLFDIPNVENKKVLLLDDAIFTGGIYKQF